jgi:hypothetical protein
LNREELDLQDIDPSVDGSAGSAARYQLLAITSMPGALDEPFVGRNQREPEHRGAVATRKWSARSVRENFLLVRISCSWSPRNRRLGDLLPFRR